MKIYCDFDNVFINSDKRVVEIINQKYGLKKTVNDIYDWGYRSILPSLTKQDVEDIYNLPEFYQKEYIFDNAIDFLKNRKFTFCTIGQEPNIKHKMNLAKDVFGRECSFLCSDDFDFDKSSWDMSGGIQIDDCVKNLLNTNAKYKILFKNFNHHTWQNVPANTEIYVVNTWKEVKNIINCLEVFPFVY